MPGTKDDSRKGDTDASEDEVQARPSETFTYRFRRFFRSVRFPVSCIILAIGSVLTILAFSAWTPLLTNPAFSSIDVTLLGSDCTTIPPCPTVPPSGAVDWTLLFFILGPILILVGLYLVYAYLKARQRFEHLMQTKSKAEFLRNIAEVEDLLWDLTPADEIRLAAKKQELKIRS